MKVIKFTRDLVESEVLSIPKEAIADLRLAATTEQQKFLATVDAFTKAIDQLPMFEDCSSDIKLFFEDVAAKRASLLDFANISTDENKEVKMLRKNLCYKLANKYDIKGVVIK